MSVPVAPGDQGHRGQELIHQAQELAVQEADRKSEKEAYLRITFTYPRWAPFTGWSIPTRSFPALDITPKAWRGAWYPSGVTI